jgi:hypothetical protein
VRDVASCSYLFEGIWISRIPSCPTAGDEVPDLDNGATHKYEKVSNHRGEMQVILSLDSQGCHFLQLGVGFPWKYLEDFETTTVKYIENLIGEDFGLYEGSPFIFEILA